MSAHTPGPWKVNDQRHSGWMSNGVYISTPSNIARVYKDESGGEEPQLANARLIAAAPEMFELLKNLKPDLENLVVQRQYDWLIQPYSMINELIKKIEGESPHDPERTRDKNE